MRKEPYPGAKCKVIGSARGPEGTSIGRIVRAVALNPIPHVIWGDMWDCEAVDGQQFDVQIVPPGGGAPVLRKMNNATFAADWLEVLEDDPTPPKVETRETELTE